MNLAQELRLKSKKWQKDNDNIVTAKWPVICAHVHKSAEEGTTKWGIYTLAKLFDICGYEKYLEKRFVDEGFYIEVHNLTEVFVTINRPLESKNMGWIKYLTTKL